ncbi:hypothetical protein SLEP1_g13921 [Rubroshorea leprosula]|uniref:Uncharacterized protein n=1 Tax=Rubroshorea leprosula TaxID=152421 RepID=A0AAV5IR97_9ROSI|nr:hypothetical protein SLEP1_g13921 [Rubroshorea leprosula]
MSSSTSDTGEGSYSPLTLSDLDLSPLKEVRFRSESDIKHELKFIEDPDYIPPSTPHSESYKTEDMSSKETISVGGSEEVRAREHEQENVEMESSRLEIAKEEVREE